MGWKPKEKPLTAEEAITLAKKELSKYWIGSEPLIAGIRGPSGVTAHPIDPQFSQKRWLFVFADPTDYTGSTALHYLLEWHHRYGDHELGMVLFLKIPFPSLRGPEIWQTLISESQLPFTLVMDADSLVSAAYGVTEPPKVVLIDRGKNLFAHQGRDWLKDTELKIQQFLRLSDPGLPLPPVYRSDSADLVDLFRIDFNDPQSLPRAAFRPTAAPKVYAAHFEKDAAFPTHARDYTLSGNWVTDGERLITSDPHASIQLITDRVSDISVIAQAVTRGPDPGIIAVELEGKPLYEGVIGADTVLADDGQTQVTLREPRSYRIASHLGSRPQKIRLLFPTAAESAVAIFGIRMAGNRVT